MSKKSDSHRVNREHFSVVNLGENDDAEYWRSGTVEEGMGDEEWRRLSSVQS